MNDLEIETLLRQAPQPQPPADLLQRLEREIELPKQAYRNGDEPRLVQSWIRRWLPAFAFGLIIMSCLVIAGMQANVASQLKKENAELRSNTSDLEELRIQHAHYERIKVQQDDLERLRADNQDLQRLRVEIEKLRPLASEVLRLRAENQRLAASLSASNRRFFAAPAPEPEADPEKANSTKCLNNLKQIGLSYKTWALDNDGRFPTVLLEMTNEFSTPMILFCPSDTAKYPSSVIGWNEFRPEMASYQFVLSGTNDDVHPRRIITKCPIHGHVGLSDGSVQAVAAAIRAGMAREVTIDGRLELEFLPQRTP